MVSNTRLAIFSTRDKMKKYELNDHIIRLERLILQDQSVLKTKEIISNSSNHELDDYEIDAHIEEVYSLEKFKDHLRAQMLVSICGYFEFATKRALHILDKNLLNDVDGLGGLIKKLSNKELGILDFPEENSLNEYRAIRNICVHSNSNSEKEDNKLSSAEKYLTGIKVDNSTSIKKQKGKGRIKLEKEFLPNALELHFNVIFKVHDFIKKHA